MYTGFAEVYDTLMNDVHYGAWADMYARMMTAYGIPRNAKVCECACGTGSLTLPLQQLGYEMMGIDLSQEMLWQAAQKARKAGFGIPFIRQDMRQLRLHRPVDAVLATCDGVNYLLRRRSSNPHGKPSSPAAGCSSMCRPLISWSTCWAASSWAKTAGT